MFESTHFTAKSKNGEFAQLGRAAAAEKTSLVMIGHISFDISHLSFPRAFFALIASI